eukprot:2278563-Pyramimonas_sp.AAC.1
MSRARPAALGDRPTPSRPPLRQTDGTAIPWANEKKPGRHRAQHHRVCSVPGVEAPVDACRPFPIDSYALRMG